jgi:hypothetical protein
MTAKEQQFKEQFNAVLADLRDAGSRDDEAMFLLGSLAANLATDGGATSWRGLKALLSQDAYTSMLNTFQKQGRTLLKQKKPKAAYAMQVLAMSLIAHTQTDPKMRMGENLLDTLIDRAADAYRKLPKTAIN